MVSGKIGIRSNFNFFADRALSNKVTESSVRDKELREVTSLKDATAKAVAVRPNPSNVQGLATLDNLSKALYKAIQTAPAPSAQTEIATETVKSPSFGF